MKRLLLFQKVSTPENLPGYLLTALFFLIFSFSAKSAEIKLEAESATLTGVSVDNAASGYSGSGYAWGFDQSTDNVTFNFTAPAGDYTLSIVYYSPYGDKGYNLQVNSFSADKTFTGTNGSFGSVDAGKYQLTEGANTVKITSGWGYYGIDYIKLTPVTSAPPVIVPLVNGRAEAESAVLQGIVVSADPAGFSGTGYVTGFDEAADQVTFNFNMEKTGLYELNIGYTSPYGDKGYNVLVNAEAGSGMFPQNTGFGSVSAGKYLLTQGLNTISVTKGWGYFGIDYIQLTPSVAALPLQPSKQLTDPQATQSARSLFSYMTDLYGHKTLSGQYDDVDYVLQNTGKEPAIGGFDLMEYSPSRIENGANPAGTSERYINWAKKGEGNGILSLTWHWNAPTDLINEAPDKLWWSGFYTRATTFDLAAALADTNSVRYKLLIRDIDSIAAQLKKFQDADIPVLWRPLHEAAGEWFWWGAKGPEPLKKLWRIMYDRFTNYHQLHNLIWVYAFTSGADMSWYPGDEYVDMVGIDIYTDPSANMSGDWADLQQKFNGKKLVSLSETGTLPVPDKIRGYGTWWSWFGVWSGDFIKKQPLDLLNKVYHDEDVITRDELPDWRMYGRPKIAITMPADKSQFTVCETPVITAEASDAEGSVAKVVFLANGNVIGTDDNTADGVKLEWKNAAAGTYTIVAKAYDNEGNTNTSAPVTLVITPDVTPPVITLASPQTVMTAQGHALKTFTLADIVKSVTDNCGPVSITRIKQVSSDEAALAAGSGNTDKDIVISADGQSVQLRAERAGSGNGRVYTIQIEAIDKSGNAALASYQVQVPKSNGKTAIADVLAYWAYGNYSAGNARPTVSKTSISDAKLFPLQVYPNPAAGNQLTIQLYAEGKQEVYFTFLNNASQAVLSFHQTLQGGNNKIQLPITKLTSGTYFLRVLKGKEQITSRIVVSK